jgi:hypothetical protein
MTQAQGIDHYGVLKAVPPGVIAVVSLWVVMADGIFWGMAAHAQRLDPWLCAVEGLALAMALAAAADSLVLRLALAILSASIFGAMIFSFCGLLGFAILVGAQVGLMHYCALKILAPRVRKLKTRLFT